MISKLNIDNLRCLEHFEMDNFSRFTLISGRNNIGKSTLIEAISLLFAARKNDIFYVINSSRGMKLAENPRFKRYSNTYPYTEEWAHFFYNLDTNRTIRICIDYEDKTYELKIAKEELNRNDLIDNRPIESYIDSSTIEYGLKLSISEKKSGKEDVIVLPPYRFAERQDDEESKSFELPNIAFCGPKAGLSESMLAKLFGKLTLLNKKNELLEIIKYLIKDVEDIVSINVADKMMLYVRTKDNVMLPLGAMGSGLNKLMDYVLPMLCGVADIYLFDEIDTYFHYSFFEKLCETLMSLAIEKNCQIIATTHSYEMIEAAYAFVDRAKLNDEFSYFRIGKDLSRNIRQFHFNDDNLRLAFRNLIEVR